MSSGDRPEPAHPGRYWHALGDGRIQCDLCPRDCKLREGQRGLCFVRRRQDDAMVLTTHGRSSGFCVDPIEKKPLNHFHPGSAVLSFGTAGCNLACRFCQNWDVSKSRSMDRLADQASPEAIAAEAKRLGCRSVAFTYNDPTIFIEYAMDVARACHDLGIATVAVSAGYIRDEPRRDLYGSGLLDAANIDLKGFSDDFYHRLCAGRLQPVLETLEYVARETDVWLEVTTLLIPGQNDSDDEVRRQCEWIHEHLGPDVPLHFSAFHPDFKMLDVPPTPPETLRRSRRLALETGLNHVYTGNVHDREGDSTSCPACRHVVIERDWYEIRRNEMRADGLCPRCGTAIAGRFDDETTRWGRRRLPVAIGTS